MLAYARANRALIERLLDGGAEPRLPDAFGRDAADLVAGHDFLSAKLRAQALRIYVARWPEGDPAVSRHAERLSSLEAELAEKEARKRAKKDKLAALLEPKALQAADWATQVTARLPNSMWGFDADLPESQQPRTLVERLCDTVLRAPRAIAHPAWGDVLRALALLSPDYGALTEDVYVKRLTPQDAGDDEGGVLDMLSDAGCSTIPDALRLLAEPAAVARPDWPALLRDTLATHATRYGARTVLSWGCEEADALFTTPAVIAHPEAPNLWDEACAVLCLESPRPGSAAKG